MAAVLSVCLQNAGRSQMSRALFTRAAGGGHQELSGGTTRADHVHPGSSKSCANSTSISATEPRSS